MFSVQVPAKEKKRKSGGATNGRKVKVPQTHISASPINSGE